MTILQHLPRLLARDATASNTTGNDTKWTEIEQYSTDLHGVNRAADDIFRDAQWWSLGVLAMLVLILRLIYRLKAHQRHLAAMGLDGEQQRYWAINRGSWWKAKKSILYAPLGSKRHNREIQLSSAMNMGIIPSRFHSILIAAYLVSNIAYCAHLNYSEPNHYAVVAELRGRTGVLAVVNMIALIILAGRNNPLIPLLQISFDTYNLLHRWMGRTVVIEAVAHIICWAVVKHAANGWSGIWDAIGHDAFIGWGTVATISMTLLFLLSPSPIRHAFYETFLNIHIILAFVAIIGVWLHCDISQLPQLPYIKAVFFLWLGDRLARVWRLISCNYTRKGCASATCEAMPGEATRVTIHLPKHMDVKPGTHAYLRFGSINCWESHPFSIAWVDHKLKDGVLPISEKGQARLCREEMRTDVSFVIQAQTGLTRRLFNKAKSCTPRVWSVRAAFEGPYAGHHSLDSYGHAVLFAGASGITHQIAFVRHLINGYSDQTIATRKVTLVWIVRDADHLEWVRPWMDTILRMPGRREVLTIKLFVTRPKNPREIVSPSNTVQMFPGRPNVKLLLENEVREQTGAMCVTVCGPGGLADNVREAVRNVQEDGVVDFIEESFTW